MHTHIWDLGYCESMPCKVLYCRCGCLCCEPIYLRSPQQRYEVVRKRRPPNVWWKDMKSTLKCLRQQSARKPINTSEASTLDRSQTRSARVDRIVQRCGDNANALESHRSGQSIRRSLSLPAMHLLRQRHRTSKRRNSDQKGAEISDELDTMVFWHLCSGDDT